MQIINGRELAEKIKDEIVKEIAGEKTGNELLNCPRPNLAIILVGDREDSKIYVSLKEKEAKKCGIDTHLYKFEENVPEEEILATIKFLNQDNLIDAILVQLPLPKHLNTDNIINAINPDKDLDGFHPENLRKINNSEDSIMPPVFGAIFKALDSLNYDLKKEKICIVSNSDVFGLNLKNIFEQKEALVEIARITDSDLREKTSRANILITAVGQPHCINQTMIKNGAIVIDVGISKENGKIYGDADWTSVENMASFATPVPGGIGPLTIACALKNVLILHKKRKHKNY